MNRADKRKFHIIYKTTCNVTGKFYIGMHSTDNLNDGYKGSGSILSRSIKKYGKDSHTCEVLEFLPDRKTLALREEQLITPELRTNKMCMNIRSGGTGNPPGSKVSEDVRKKVSDGLKKTWADRKAKGFKAPVQSPEVIAKRANALRGKKRTAEQKENMSQIQKETSLRLFSDIDYASNFSEKVKAGLSNMTSEAKDKMLQKQITAANKRPPMSAEHIAKCTAYHRGKKRSSDTIAKMIAGHNKNLISKTVARKKQDRTWTIEGPDKKLFTVVNLKKFCIENNVPMSIMYKTLINNKSVNGFKAVSVSDTFYEKTVRIRK